MFVPLSTYKCYFRVELNWTRSLQRKANISWQKQSLPKMLKVKILILQLNVIIIDIRIIPGDFLLLVGFRDGIWGVKNPDGFFLHPRGVKSLIPVLELREKDGGVLERLGLDENSLGHVGCCYGTGCTWVIKGVMCVCVPTACWKIVPNHIQRYYRSLDMQIDSREIYTSRYLGYGPNIWNLAKYLRLRLRFLFLPKR